MSGCSDSSQIKVDSDLVVEKKSKTEFERYAEKNLSQLKWVARDGSIINDPSFSVDYTKLPAFKEISHIPDRKQAFFDYLRPAIDFQNSLITERREILKGIDIKLEQSEELTDAQKVFMETMRDRYRIPAESTVEESVAVLFKRVDILPESMVLAQAAMESAWGTSRFAREANNLFGHWCFRKGCGLVPAQRSKGMKHEVRKFVSVDKAIEAYFLNINSYPTYVMTRDIREKIRSEGKPITGHELVAGLEKYSARGLEYIEELRSMIRTNKLES
jgi:Bax protein